MGRKNSRTNTLYKIDSLLNDPVRVNRCTFFIQSEPNNKVRQVYEPPNIHRHETRRLVNLPYLIVRFVVQYE